MSLFWTLFSCEVMLQHWNITIFLYWYINTLSLKNNIVSCWTLKRLYTLLKSYVNYLLKAPVTFSLLALTEADTSLTTSLPEKSIMLQDQGMVRYKLSQYLPAVRKLDPVSATFSILPLMRADMARRSSRTPRSPPSQHVITYHSIKYKSHSLFIW